MSKPWFGAKRYGLGLSPASPAGWLATVLYMALMAGAAAACKTLGAAPWLWPAIVAVLTIGFVVLAFVKSDHQPLRWRWGGR